MGESERVTLRTRGTFSGSRSLCCDCWMPSLRGVSVRSVVPRPHVCAHVVRAVHVPCSLYFRTAEAGPQRPLTACDFPFCADSECKRCLRSDVLTNPKDLFAGAFSKPALLLQIKPLACL